MFGWNGAKRQKTYLASKGAERGYRAKTGVMSGVVSGTKVATEFGWRDVASLQAGDLVLTFDAGLQPITSVSRTPLWSGEGACPRSFWPLLVPAGILENDVAMVLLPRQGVMLESDVAEETLGDPFAIVPAAALEGVHGIERVFPQDDMCVVTLHFDCAQVVFAEQGALLFCAAGGDMLDTATRAFDAAPACTVLSLVLATEVIQSGAVWA